MSSRRKKPQDKRDGRGIAANRIAILVGGASAILRDSDIILIFRIGAELQAESLKIVYSDFPYTRVSPSLSKTQCECWDAEYLASATAYSIAATDALISERRCCATRHAPHPSLLRLEAPLNAITWAHHRITFPQLLLNADKMRPRDPAVGRSYQCAGRKADNWHSEEPV